MFLLNGGPPSVERNTEAEVFSILIPHRSTQKLRARNASWELLRHVLAVAAK
ncbi:MAG: hypothetical protein U0136_10410 [Bdellovibrionota bacterium]